MKRTTLFLTLVLLMASYVFAYEKQSINITVNGKPRNMVVFTPNSFPAKSPLFIVTHGMNQDPEYQYGSDKMYEMIDTAKFVITYLRSDGSTWDTGGTNDQTFVSKAIDEMASRFDIDRDRVYWSGFSMGSMLIHHCIANMQNKIAAFAPTSGIQFSEQPWNKCNKPVNLLECIAYDDDVFGYEQYGIHAYIENYAKHDKHTKYSKTIGYKYNSSNWQDGDLEKWTGGPNGGEVWLYSYNSGGHWPSDQNRQLIWNFCKRFSLNQPKANITEPTGETTFVCLSPKDQVTFPDIDVEATAKATQGTISKVDIYLDNTLLNSQTEAPYTATVSVPEAGKYNLRVEATDSNGKTGESSCALNYKTHGRFYRLADDFFVEGVIPQNWYVSNGSNTFIGGGMPSTSGPRVLRFTNNTRDFDYGLFVENNTNKEKAAWAKFGVKEGRSSLNLYTGSYKLNYKICNWNQADFSPVTVAIETLDGQVIASQTYTPTFNFGGKVNTKFSSITAQSLEFDITKRDNYVVAIYADAKRHADFVIGQLNINIKKFDTTGIESIENTPAADNTIYDLQGRKVTEPAKGLYIVNGRKVVIK